jgi:hypothetical protein
MLEFVDVQWYKKLYAVYAGVSSGIVFFIVSMYVPILKLLPGVADRMLCLIYEMVIKKVVAIMSDFFFRLYNIDGKVCSKCKNPDLKREVDEKSGISRNYCPECDNVDIVPICVMSYRI